MDIEKTVIAICGATAAGKTDFAIDQALKFNTSVISADSRQCFKELNIGVAKPTPSQLAATKHYFINSHSIFDKVDAGIFENYSLRASSEIFTENNVAILTGGTGLYVQSFLRGMDNIPAVDTDIVASVRSKFETGGIEWLKQEIKRYDPHFFNLGEMQNPQRMMRALTVIQSTGKSILAFHSSGKNQRNFKVQKIFLDPPRGILYEKINKRVDLMMEQGLLEECQSLVSCKDMNALQTVGYKELFDYFDKKISLQTAVELIKRNTRHFAKRQLTWFKKYFIDDQTQIIIN